MAKKKPVKGDFEDMTNDMEDSFEFDDEDFGDIEEKKQQLKRKKNYGHKMFFGVAVIILILCGVSLLL